MDLKLRFDAQARQDLIEIRRYLVEHAGVVAANRVRQHLRERMHVLRSLPMLGAESVEPGVRVLFPTRYPYRIYYSVTATELFVLHIRHTSRAPHDFDDASD